MSEQTALDQLRRAVLRDSTLQARLWQADEPDAMVALLELIGAERGMIVSATALLSALFESRAAWREQGTVIVEPIALDGWVPIRLRRRDADLLVEWCYLGQRRLLEPFFEQTVVAALRHPFNRLIRLQTPIEALRRLSEVQPGRPPTGLIFHMSRCGSTLLAQLLAQLPQTTVIAEAEPIDAALRQPDAEDGLSAARLRWIAGALTRQHAPEHVFVKLDSWHILDLPVLRRAFPEATCVFVFRDPVEVLVSHAAMRGSQMVPGLIDPAMFGLSAADLPGMSLDRYCAHVLATICAAATGHTASHQLRYVNYSQLPSIVWTTLLAELGVAVSSDDIDRLRQAARFNAKQPARLFHADSTAKQQAATEDLRRLSDELIRPHYQRLLALAQHQTGYRDRSATSD